MGMRLVFRRLRAAGIHEALSVFEAVLPREWKRA